MCKLVLGASVQLASCLYYCNTISPFTNTAGRAPLKLLSWLTSFFHSKPCSGFPFQFYKKAKLLQGQQLPVWSESLDLISCYIFLLLPAHSASDAPTVPKTCYAVSASGPLHWLSFLLGKLFFQTSIWLTPLPFKSLLIFYLFTEATLPPFFFFKHVYWPETYQYVFREWLGFPGSSVVKNLPSHAGDTG